MTRTAPPALEHAPPGSGAGAVSLPAFPAHRVTSLADGVFAIVLTLLVLELHVPASAALDAAGRHQALLTHLPEIGHSLLWYVVTGLAAGRYWMMHSRLLQIPHEPVRNVAHLTVLLLLAVSLLPFAASLISRYPGDGLAIAVYSGLQALINAGFLLLLRAIPAATAEGAGLWTVLRANAFTSLVIGASAAALAPWLPDVATLLLPCSLLIRWQVTPRWARRGAMRRQTDGASPERAS